MRVRAFLYFVAEASCDLGNSLFCVKFHFCQQYWAGEEREHLHQQTFKKLQEAFTCSTRRRLQRIHCIHCTGFNALGQKCDLLSNTFPRTSLLDISKDLKMLTLILFNIEVVKALQALTLCFVDSGGGGFNFRKLGNPWTLATSSLLHVGPE